MEGPETRSKTKQKGVPGKFAGEKLAPAGLRRKLQKSNGANKTAMTVSQGPQYQALQSPLADYTTIDPIAITSEGRSDIHPGNANTGSSKDGGWNRNKSRNDEAHDSDRFLYMRAENLDSSRLQELIRENESLREKNQDLLRRLQHNDFQEPKSKDARPGSNDLKQEGSYSLLPLIIKADSYSWAEVEDMVALLNGEIRHLASFLVDELSAAFASTYPHPLVVESSPTINTLYKRLGRRFTHFLLSTVTADQRHLVRVALRSVLVTDCKRFVQCWSTDAGHDAVLAELYGDVLNHYPALAGHWRSMAKESIRGRPKRDLTNYFHRILVNEIVMVLRAAGWQNYNAQETIGEKFAEPIKELVKIVIQVRDAIGSDIVSHDLRLFCSQHDMPFDSTTMIYDSHCDQENVTLSQDVVNQVAACTGLGLIVNSAIGDVRNDVHNADGMGRKGRILLKGPVMLYSALSPL